MVGYVQYVLEKGRFLGECTFCNKRGLGWNMKTGEEFVQKALGWNGVSLRLTEVSSAAAPGQHLVGRGCPLKGWYRLRSFISGKQMISSVSVQPCCCWA